MDFELDNENLKKVTGLRKLVGEEEGISEESEIDSDNEDDNGVAAGGKGGSGERGEE